MPSGVRSVWGASLRGARHVLAQTQEVFRAALFLMLGFAARRLPRRIAYNFSGAVRWCLALSPLGVRARQTMRAAFPSQSREVAALAAEWLERPFRDHVNAVRIATAREHMRDWEVEMRGAPDLLSDPAQSCIIATGHFSRQAMGVLYLQAFVPKRLATVVAPMTQAKTPQGFRVRLQMREIRKGIAVAGGGGVDIADVAGKGFLVRLLRHLREPGGAVIIATDAAWHGEQDGGYTRPFAAFAAHTFHLGTARLARLSQRPIVTCVPFLHGDQCVVMEWSPVIQPPAREDTDADVRITNEILDWIERRIGERPGQYVEGFGHERRWSSIAKCWIGAETQSTPALARASALEARDA
jgi:lauroyl/myristoyl acyltransferase